MSKNTFLYAVRTQGGITYYIEAHNLAEAEKRASDATIGRTIYRMIRDELSSVVAIEPHKGPGHTLANKLVFRHENFS